MWTFEPSAALFVFNQMLDSEKIKIFYNERLERTKGVKKVNNKIKHIVMESGLSFFWKCFY